MDYLYIIIAQVLGSLAIITEVLVPSFGMLTILSITLFGYSYYQMWSVASSNIAILILFDVFFIPIVLLFAVKVLSVSGLSLRKRVSNSISKGSNKAKLIGLEGVVTSDLRPSGKIMVDSKLLDAIADGDYIEKGCRVMIKSIDISSVKVVRLS